MTAQLPAVLKALRDSDSQVDQLLLGVALHQRPVTMRRPLGRDVATIADALGSLGVAERTKLASEWWRRQRETVLGVAQRGHYDLAFAAAEQATAVCAAGTHDVRAHVLMAALHTVVGHPEAALQHLHSAVSDAGDLHPVDHATTSYLRGVALLDLGETDAARHELIDAVDAFIALREDGCSGAADSWLALAEAQATLTEALECVREARSLCASLPDGSVELAECTVVQAQLLIQHRATVGSDLIAELEHALSIFSQRRCSRSWAEAQLVLVSALEHTDAVDGEPADRDRSLLSRLCAACLVLEADRYDFADPTARRLWFERIVEPALARAMAMAARLDDVPVLTDLVLLARFAGSLDADDVRDALARSQDPSSAADDLGLRGFGRRRAPQWVCTNGWISLQQARAMVPLSFGLRLQDDDYARYPHRDADDDDVMVQGVEIGDDVYVTWRDADTGGGWARVPVATVRAAVARLHEALPTVLDADRHLASASEAFATLTPPLQRWVIDGRGTGALAQARAIHRAVTGPLSTVDGERELMATLSEVLLPPSFRQHVVRRHEEGLNTRVHVLAPRLAASVPWFLLPVSERWRLFEVADSATTAPALARDADGVSSLKADTETSACVAVLDPLTARLGRLLPDDSTLSGDLVAEGWNVVLPQSIVTGDDLLAAAERAQALIVAGHAVGHTGGARDVGLALSGETFTGLDVLCHRLASPEGRGWPRGVAVLACQSAADLRSREPFGLSTAFLECGSSVVVGTRWPVFSDAVYALIGDSSRGHPLTTLATAAAAIITSPDPIRALSSWRRERYAAWLAHPGLANSPLTWAALTLHFAPRRHDMEAEP